MNTLKTNTVRTLLIAVCGAVCLTFGCAEQQQTRTVEQICTANLGKAEAMKIAEDVLSGLHFTIAKADAEAGIITTKPLPAGQFFEFWRGDNVGAASSLEANLHSIRRTAQLDINQKDEQLCISCTVKTERLDLPRPQVSTSAEAYEFFTASSNSRHSLELRSQEKAWVDLGNDAGLAAKVLKSIEKQIPASR